MKRHSAPQGMENIKIKLGFLAHNTTKLRNISLIDYEGGGKGYSTQRYRI